MDFKAENLGKIPSGDVFYLASPLNNQIEAFHTEGIPAPHIVLPEDDVDIRLDGKFEKKDFGTRTSLTPLAVKGENTILYKGSPWMSSPEMARVIVKAHSEGRYAQLPREFYEAVKETAKAQGGLEPEDRTAIILSQRGDFDLTPEMDDTRFIIGRRAKEYFDVKGHKTIQFFDITSDSKKEADVNYSWFNYPRGGSGLGARGGGLVDHDGAFGVLRNAAGIAKNSGFTLSEIGKANSENVPEVLTERGFQGAIEQVRRPLTRGLLERLRLIRK